MSANQTPPGMPVVLRECVQRKIAELRQREQSYRRIIGDGSANADRVGFVSNALETALHQHESQCAAWRTIVEVAQDFVNSPPLDMNKARTLRHHCDVLRQEQGAAIDAAKPEGM